VTIPELNDSKYIGACIYNVVVVCIFGVPLAHVLPREQETLMFILESCLIVFCTMVCQCIIFIPKVSIESLVNILLLVLIYNKIDHTSKIVSVVIVILYLTG